MITTLFHDVESERQDWLEARKSRVGSSDIPILLGLSKYKTPLALWLEKTGQVKEQEDTIRLRMGRIKEPIIAQLFNEETGLKTWKAGQAFENDKYPRCMATPDYWVEIDGMTCPLELKNVSSMSKSQWADGETPDYALAQINWQLGILGKETGVICALIGDSEIVWRRVEFDKPLFDLMIDRANEFLSLVQSNTPPAAQADDWKVVSKATERVEETIDLNEKALKWFEQYDKAKEKKDALALEMKTWSAKMDEAKANLILALGMYTSGVLGRWKVEAKTIEKGAYEVKPTSYISVSVKKVEEQEH